MKEILAIAWREIEVRIYRRSFYLGSLVLPVLLTLLVLSPLLLLSQSGARREVVVFDQSGDALLFQTIDEKVRNSGLGFQFALSRVAVAQGEDVNERMRQQRWQLGGDTRLAMLVLPGDVLLQGQPEYYAGNVDDPFLIGLSQTIGLAVTERRLAQHGIAPADLERGMKNTGLKLIQVKAEGETQPRRGGLILPMMLFMMMYFGVSRAGPSVLTGMLEEKQSKVIEVLISSVKPIHLMIGKLLGIGTVGLAQIALWLGAVAVVRLFANPFLSRAGGQVGIVTSDLLGAFLGFFILGYFMFGTIYAILGAMISRPEDFGMFQRPLALLNMVPLFALLPVLRDPNGSVAVIFSMIPLFAPPLMLVRMAIVPPPVWQIILSIILMLLTMAAAIWAAAKVYRVKILLYGKRLTFVQVARWFKYS